MGILRVGFFWLTTLVIPLMAVIAIIIAVRKYLKYEAAIEQYSKQSEPSANSLQEQSIFCTKCGKQISDEAKFCSDCGEAIIDNQLE